MSWGGVCVFFGFGAGVGWLRILQSFLTPFTDSGRIETDHADPMGKMAGHTAGRVSRYLPPIGPVACHLGMAMFHGITLGVLLVFSETAG
jgi:hypothetical protein